MSHLKPRNEVELTRERLLVVLNDLSQRILVMFRRPVRLVVHGGAVMVLHQSLASRKSTRDVDYCHRSFIAEWQRRGVPDAGARLDSCIAATAQAYQLGADWMNAAADVALPMSYDAYGNVYDPIYRDTVEPANVTMNTIYSSPGLVLIGVSWSWAVALKLVRYQRSDPYDIACILYLGYRMKGVQWTRQVLESWLTSMCSPMNYAAYPLSRMEETRGRMRHAIALAKQLHSPGSTSTRYITQRSMPMLVH